MYPSPQKLNYLQKKVTPPPATMKNLEHPTKNSSHWEYLNPMRNLKLLEKYQPRHQKKENLNLQENKKNKKTLLVKV